MLKILAMIGTLATNSSFTDFKTIDPVQMQCLATAVYSEARGESPMGQAAVAWGIKHRAQSKDFPALPCDIIYDERHAPQFPDIKTIKIDYDSAAWDSAVEVAILSWIGFIDDPIKGARFWYAPKKVEKPSWAKMKFTKQIENHIFYDVRSES